MATKIAEEDSLRKKVWKIINLTQANQLFVHSKNLEIKYLDTETQKVKRFKYLRCENFFIFHAYPNSSKSLFSSLSNKILLYFNANCCCFLNSELNFGSNMIDFFLK